MGGEKYPNIVIKFLLVIQMCYQASGMCLPPMEEKVYNTFRECSLTGYTKAHKFILALPEEKVNQYQTIIKFWCESQKPEKTKKEISL